LDLPMQQPEYRRPTKQRKERAHSTRDHERPRRPTRGGLVEITTYSAVCHRVGGWWAISVPKLKGVHTQARRLDQVAAMAQDAVALMLDIDPATVHIDVHPDLPSTVTHALGARQAAQIGRASCRE